MKILARISLVSLLVFPLITFFVGYYVGNRDVEVVVAYQDPLITTSIAKEFSGNVSGTSSARRIPLAIAEKKQTVTTVYKNGYVSQDVWQEINSYRQSKGLATFGQDDTLCVFAQTRIDDLKSLGKLDNHAGFNSRVREYLEKHSFRKLAENMAQGYDSSAGVVEGWKGSAGHHATLLASDLNVGCVRSEASFAVLIAGRR